jgi:sarcosine oxidase subunit beta
MKILPLLTTIINASFELKYQSMSVIIIGGGIIGGAIAHYAAKAGIMDITLLEKEKLLGTGATQYCSGGVRYQFSTPINVKFSIAAFPELEKYDIGMHRYGYLILDMANDSMPRVKMQNDLGVKSEYLAPAQLKERFPYINADGVKSASFHKLDGIAEPAKLMELYEKGAKAGGVKIKTGVTVKKIIKEGGRVIGVETTEGIIKAYLPRARSPAKWQKHAELTLQ